VGTGKPLWKTYTVPAPGEPGSETWPNGDQWKTGGGSIWVTGAYDPATNLAFWGTGNGGPWMGDQRPGDNLYTSSTIALDAASGDRQGSRILSVALGRQKLAAGRVQPEDPDDLHPGQRKSLRANGRPSCHLHGGPRIHRGQPRVVHRSRRRPHRGSAGMERR